MRTLLLLTIMLVILSSSGTVNSKLTYDVLRNGEVIGYLHASKAQNGNQVDYIAESSVNVRVLMSFSLYSKVTGAFRNGMLMNGTAIRKVNGRDKVKTQIQWQDNHYVLKEDEGHGPTLINEKITYTTACLFNQEPAGLNRIFSENFGKFITIKEVRPHYYELHLPDGNKNYYSYSNGVCVSAEMNTNFSKAYFRLKK